VRNALFADNKDKDNVILPYCIYTDPEIASVGKNEK
jgi:pyruvate/2-oxoglutarate dehydrogenase complex dihydrolipoamide dehydrogenase (E3) component